jgi:hypothetical protein
MWIRPGSVLAELAGLEDPASWWNMKKFWTSEGCWLDPGKDPVSIVFSVVI